MNLELNATVIEKKCYRQKAKSLSLNENVESMFRVYLMNNKSRLLIAI